MSAATRESYADAADRLATFGAQATVADLSTIAGEILSVARLLKGEPRLRRALTDPAKSATQRAELLSTLLNGKVAATTIDLLSALAAGRWSSGGELLTATERLGVDAVLTSAARAGELAEVEDELFRFGQIVSAHSGLAATLSDPSITRERKVGLVKDLLKGKVRAGTGALVEVALDGLGGRNVEAALSKLVELTAEKRDREVAYVTVARILDEADEQRLEAKLSEMYGRGVSLKIDVDPAIIGGMSVRVGSDLYDGTILRRLNQARQAFAK